MSAAKCQLNEAEKKLLKEKQDRGVTVVGIDLAARVIQVSYLQKNGAYSDQLEHSLGSLEQWV